MAVTIKLTEEENNVLRKLTSFTDMNEEWKFMSPFFYKKKGGYYEVYSKDEYLDLKEKVEKKK